MDEGVEDRPGPERIANLAPRLRVAIAIHETRRRYRPFMPHGTMLDIAMGEVVRRRGESPAPTSGRRTP